MFTEFEQLVSPDLHRYLSSILHDEDLADDVYQEVLILLVKKAEQFHEDRSLRGWVYSIARRRAIDALRARGRNPVLGLCEGTDIAESTPSTPLDALLRAESTDYMTQEFNALSDVDREIIELRYVHSLKHREIMGILGITLANVRIRLYRAKKLLQQKMEQYCA